MADRLRFSHSGFTPRYGHHYEYPWERLERAAGVQFNEAQRREIFELYGWFEGWRAEAEQMPTLASIENLRREISALCWRLHDVTGVVTGDEERENLFDALCWRMGDGLRDAVEGARRAAFEAACELDRPPRPGAIIEDIRAPAAAILRRVVEYVRTPERPGERSRAEAWGLQPGRRSPAFRRFLAVLMERSEPEVGEDELKNALAAMKQRRERSSRD